jgi:putative membrane protein
MLNAGRLTAIAGRREGERKGRMIGIKPFGLIAAAAVVGFISGGCAFLQQTLPGVTLSDSNVISVLDSLDEGEIEAARLARDKASAPEVQAFAGRVLNEHRDLAEANGRLAAQLSVQPKPPALVNQLNAAHERAMRRLRSISGPAFDRAYVAHEIKQHVMALNFVEAAAETEGNPVLKQELVRTGPDLLSHISAARALERHLGPDLQQAAAH